MELSSNSYKNYSIVFNQLLCNDIHNTRIIPALDTYDIIIPFTWFVARLYQPIIYLLTSMPRN